MIKGKKYTGVIVPAVTPLTDKCGLDETAAGRLFSMFYKHNISPFILGTTGEAASLPLQVKKDYVLTAEKNKKTGTLLYAGIGSNILTESIEFGNLAFLLCID